MPKSTNRQYITKAALETGSGLKQQTKGENLKQLFVNEYFPEEARKRYVDIVKNIGDTYQDRILALIWTSDSTKNERWINFERIQKGGYSR